ncbi:hypothetical protein LCGC14_0434440 [marine sediment metagenome]|uniref:Uncharacterized protein n=1 Tax=marine sediment metagenome TaxID=412755 RepID=A0A0F9STI3_9ZZZZ
MTGGLPRAKKIQKSVGLGKDVVGFSKIGASAEVLGADFLADITAPPEVKIPPLPAPAPAPTPLDQATLQKERARRRQRINAAGRQGTILTGGSVLGGPGQTGSSLLGG